MRYKYECYLTDICEACNAITGKNYTYQIRKQQASIFWFENGKKQEYNLDVQLYYGPLHLKASEVARMVIGDV